MNLKNLLILVVSVVCVASRTLPAVGQLSMTAPVQVSTTAGAHDPAMHVGRDGAVYVSWFQANADIYFSRSTDQGKTFGVPVRVCRQVTTNSSTSLLQRAPEFAIDTKGVIHLVWTEARVTSGSDVWYVRSTDSGKTWTPPLSIMDSGDSANYSQDFSAIACDSSDNLYVSFLDNRYIMAKTGKHYRMHLERSTNGGQTWSLPVIADKLPVDTSGTCECCRQDIAASPEGHVYIAFRTNMNVNQNLDDRSIFICRSWDKGVTWDSSIRCQLGTWNLNGCPTKGPHIALDMNENLFVSWDDARDDSSALVAYFSMLRAGSPSMPKGSSSIFPNYSISDKKTQAGHWPYVAVSPTGLIAYAYMPGETLGGPIQFTYSSDGGNTWIRTHALPGSAGDNQSLPELSFDARGHVYAVWQDGVANGILFSNISGLDAPVAPDSITLPPATYAPGTPVRLHWPLPKNLRSGAFVWFRVTGIPRLDTTIRDTSILLGVLAPGQYTIAITAHIAADSTLNFAMLTVEAQAVSADQQSLDLPEVFPNPAHGDNVFVSLPTVSTANATIQISDESGKIVQSTTSTVSDGKLLLDLRGLSNGTYRSSILQGTNHWNVPIVLSR